MALRRHGSASASLRPGGRSRRWRGRRARSGADRRTSDRSRGERGIAIAHPVAKRRRRDDAPLRVGNLEGDIAAWPIASSSSFRISFRYFPAIDHEILKRELRRRIACERTLWLADAIIHGSNPQEPVLLHYPGDDLLTPVRRRRRGLPIA